MKHPALILAVLAALSAALGNYVPDPSYGDAPHLGLYMVLRNVNSFSAYVIPGEMTEISVTMDLATNQKQSKRMKEVYVYFAGALAGPAR